MKLTAQEKYEFKMISLFIFASVVVGVVCLYLK